MKLFEKFREKAKEAAAQLPIGDQELTMAMELLRRYKAGKANADRRIVENEQWWKLRHWDYMENPTTELKTKSAWLVNMILAKHADAMDAFPEPCFLPRAQDDEAEAKTLSSIVPVILEQNDFEAVWSDNWWKKLKSGAGIYGVFWDHRKLNGLGDIAITKIDPLNLYWEPGITDLQKSKHLFHVELTDTELLEQQYPQLAGRLSGKSFTAARYLYDDSVDLSGKTPVIDWYYHKLIGGRNTLQYVQFAGDTVLYATENDPESAERGLYDHGKYPFVADVMFPEEGTPLGFSYIDLCKDPQRQIDLMNTAIVSNCIAAATPRYLVRGDGGINEEEFADLTRTFVHVQGSLDEAALRQITISPLSGNYLNILSSKIGEMKETTGNRDVSNGGTATGVTAASAIAAMQEQSGKLSRDQIQNSYRCYRKVNELVVELLRQFYTVPRQFRITGELGRRAFVTFDNHGLSGKPQGTDFGQDMGLRAPLFDIEITSQRQNAYTKLSANELALQLFQLGFFNPALSNQALPCLQMMDFKGREEMMQAISETASALPADVPMQSAAPSMSAQKKADRMEQARENARAATRPRQ